MPGKLIPMYKDQACILISGLGGFWLMTGQVYCLQTSSRGACDRESHSLIWLEREKERDIGKIEVQSYSQGRISQ